MCQRPVVLKTAAAESGTAAQAPGTDLTKAASCSSSQGSCGQKAKALDVHLPSLKRRKLGKFLMFKSGTKLFIHARNREDGSL